MAAQEVLVLPAQVRTLAPQLPLSRSRFEVFSVRHPNAIPADPPAESQNPPPDNIAA